MMRRIFLASLLASLAVCLFASPGLAGSALSESKTSLGMGNVENTALSTWAGTTNITTLGTITSGTWTATDIALNAGGTNASLTAANGGLVYSTATAFAILAAGSSGQIPRSGGAGAPSWSTATYPSTATATGSIFRADGSNWVETTATYPNTTTANRILYSSANNVVGQITSAAGGVLVTDSGGIPSIIASSANGQIPIANVAGSVAWATISGTTNQVSVTNGASAITLATPQNIDTAATVTFGTITAGSTGGGNVFNVSGSGTNNARLHFGATGTDVYIGHEGSAGNALIANAPAYATVIRGDGALSLSAGGNTERLRIATDGTILATGSFTTTAAAPTNVTTAGTFIGTGGFAVGDVLNSWIDDATHGSGSTAMLIGNQTITVSSDRRIKSDIKPSAINALEVINHLKVVDFRWKKGTMYASTYNGGEMLTGLIAQDVAKTLPQFINENGVPADGPIPPGQEWKIDYQSMVPITFKAIQEEDAKVVALQAQVASQQAQIDSLKAQMAAIGNAPAIPAVTPPSTLTPAKTPRPKAPQRPAKRGSWNLWIAS